MLCKGGMKDLETHREPERTHPGVAPTQPYYDYTALLRLHSPTTTTQPPPTTPATRMRLRVAVLLAPNRRIRPAGLASFLFVFLLAQRSADVATEAPSSAELTRASLTPPSLLLTPAYSFSLGLRLPLTPGSRLLTPGYSLLAVHELEHLADLLVADREEELGAASIRLHSDEVELWLWVQHVLLARGDLREAIGTSRAAAGHQSGRELHWPLALRWCWLVALVGGVGWWRCSWQRRR